MTPELSFGVECALSEGVSNLCSSAGLTPAHGVHERSCRARSGHRAGARAAPGDTVGTNSNPSPSVWLGSATLPTQPLPFLLPGLPCQKTLIAWLFPLLSSTNLFVQPSQLLFVRRRDKPGLSPACGLIYHLELCCRMKLLIQT